ncbi:MAG TPA: DUF177 domain-containing protein [Thermoanaerobaculia bacterium]|nr:DUF177 domain-containing protein [Thermoanaerobaculia bacterium]
MKIRLENARAEPFRWQESIRPTTEGLELEEPVELSPVAVRGTLSWVDPGYLLRAQLSYSQTVPCDRCLTPVTEEIEATLELLVVERRGGGGDGGERQLHEDDFGVLEVAGEWLETEPIVAEQVQLGLPTHPLCREDCAGLCPVCGRDRNREACDCAEQETDPRWAALAAWKQERDGHDA